MNLQELCTYYDGEMKHFVKCVNVRQCRNNRDTSLNNYGYQCIEYLQYHKIIKIYILHVNGRTSGNLAMYKTLMS